MPSPGSSPARRSQCAMRREAQLELAEGLDPLAVAVDQRRLVGTLLRNRGHCRHGARASLAPCRANALHSTRGAANLARMSDAVRDLLAFIDASPTPYHAIAETVRRLAAAGFRECSESELWSLSPGDRRWVVRNGGSLVAFQVGSESPVEGGFRIVGAHSDSPNLRAKPLADVNAHGYRQLAVEPYGGVLLHTWLDRDLSLAGRVTLRDGAATRTALLDFGRPLVRIPSLAIHLNREIRETGLKLNPQTQALPLLGLEDAPSFAALVATELRAQQLADVAPEDLLAHDLMLYDVQPSSALGADGAFIAAPRLDNLASCHAAVSALLARHGAASSAAPRARSSSTTTRRSAARARRAPPARSCSSRSSASSPASRAASRRASRARAPRSLLVSADMAHARAPELRRQARARPPPGARARPGDQVEREPVVRERRPHGRRVRRAVRAGRRRAAALQLAQRPAVRLDDRPDHRRAHRHSDRRRRQSHALDALLPRDGGLRRRRAHDPRAPGVLRRRIERTGESR